ncbi:MAG TPA: pyrroloquinoline quinone biosynthesis protein PqqB [Bryobacteraceae bacterium]|nr:pyrroloquinoline quinone biosynthesis protein PqqB [Bryobacteraceae bacterium]
MRVKILGSAAGGGFPQWNCACSNCRRIRNGTLQGFARTQAQIAISSDGQSWYLLNASPDLPKQIEAFAPLQPSARSRETPIAAIVLTSADLDQVLGLILLRESQPLRVYATRAIRKILVEHNIVFGMVKDQVAWDEIAPGGAFELRSVSGENSGIKCLPFSLAGNYPYYVGRDLAATLLPEEALMGLAISEPAGGSMVYMPAAPRIEESWIGHFERADVLLFDGTFWSDDELVRVRGGGRTARQIGHIPISGTEGSLALLAGLKRPRKIFIHVNNTNPILDEASAEYRQVREAGWEVARDGEEFEL